MNEKETIVNLLKKSKYLNHLKDEQIFNLIEVPHNLELGDFAFPCFSLSKELKLNPNNIAEKIRIDLGHLSSISLSDFENIETKGPYINFFLNKRQLTKKTINEILEKKDYYGSMDIGKKQKALIEHTSINPNASPHVGRSRNAIIGDSIVRILRFMNFDVEVHYYVNDVSKQIAMLVLAEADKLPFEKMLKKYVEISKKVEKSEELEKKVFSFLKKFEQGDKSTIRKFRKITQTCVKGQEKILSQLGIKYDVFDYESDYLAKSNEILKELDFEQISEALKLLNINPPKVVHYSFILLSEKSKKSRKMSTRKGDVVLLEDFIKKALIKAEKKAKRKDYADKIAVSAIKYSILRNNPNKTILFNLDDALNFEGDTGPYMLYSYARASSIIKKAKKKHEAEDQEEKIGELEKKSELIKKLSQFPEIILKAYDDLNPSHIANYSYDLAKIFNEFYHLSKVIGSKDEEFKLQLVQAFRQVMKNSLFLLGIDVIEEM